MLFLLLQKVRISLLLVDWLVDCSEREIHNIMWHILWAYRNKGKSMSWCCLGLLMCMYMYANASNWFFANEYIFFSAFLYVFLLLCDSILSSQNGSAAVVVLLLPICVVSWTLLCASHFIPSIIRFFFSYLLKHDFFLAQMVLVFSAPLNASDRIVGTFSTFSLCCLRWLSFVYSSFIAYKFCDLKRLAETVPHRFRSDTLS